MTGQRSALSKVMQRLAHPLFHIRVSMSTTAERARFIWLADSVSIASKSRKQRVIADSDEEEREAVDLPGDDSMASMC